MNLVWRISLGALLIAGLAGLCYLDSLAGPSRASSWLNPPGGWLFLLALLASVLGTGEVISLARSRGTQPIPWIAYLFTFAIVATNVIPSLWPTCPVTAKLGLLAWPMLAVAAGLLAAFLGEMARYEKPGEVLRQLTATVFPMLYVGVLLTFVVQLRQWRAEEGLGLVALLSMIVVVKMGDSGAYTIGRIFGRHKMAPVLSPGKTWEGFAGAMLFAVLGALLVWWLAPKLSASDSTLSAKIGPCWGWILYGLIVGLAGLLGDLAESLLKRDAGVKDSSTWMPGFGGVLDVLDSILIAAPVAFFCWAVGLVGA